jgi:hypothetical protein
VTRVLAAPDCGDTEVMFGVGVGGGDGGPCTVTDTVALIMPTDAVTFAVPIDMPRTYPSGPTETALEPEDYQVANAVRSSNVPSGNVPMAVNCCNASRNTATGEIAIDTGIATSIAVDRLKPPTVAVRVDTPAVIANTVPALTDATAGFEELQTTDCSV